MAERESDVMQAKRNTLRHAQEHAEEAQHAPGPIPQGAMMDAIGCRPAASCVPAHASAIHRAAGSSPARTEQVLTELQRRYGNQHVGRVLSLARQPSGEEQGSGVPGAVEAAIQSERGRGQSLDNGVRRQMEGALGAEFSGVRVHDNPQADSLNTALSARAFTTGQDIFFSRGAYEPGSSSGRELIAHELTHVVQQSGDTVRRAMSVSQPGDPYEVEAETTARQIMQAENSGLHRQADAAPSQLARASAEIQREPATPPTTDAPATAGAPSTPAQATPSPGSGAKTADLTLTAIYEDVPGTAQDKVRRATEKEALWLDPLTMLSNYPVAKRATVSEGLVAGGGQKTVDTYKAPVSEETPISGRGSITASLKYAGDRNASFNVAVSGLKHDVSGAEAMARKIIEQEFRTYGDVGEIAATAEKQLNAIDKYQGAKVTISVRDSKVMDAGRTTFYYKVHGDAAIQMNVQAVPVGEKESHYSGSKTSGSTTEDESGRKETGSQQKQDISKNSKDTYKKDETSSETQESAYNEQVVRTLDDTVKKATTVRGQIADDLAEQIIDTKNTTLSDKETSDRQAHASQKFETDVKKTVESGKRDKGNWANTLSKGVKAVKKVTSIPFIDKVPVIGWFSRKVKGWYFDVAEAVLEPFVESGTVDFTDTKLEGKDTSSQDLNDKTTRDRQAELKQSDKTEVKKKLVEDFNSKTDEDWHRYLSDITDIRKAYYSKLDKSAQTAVDQTHSEDYKKQDQGSTTESDQRHKATTNQSITTHFDMATTWKFTKPVVQATPTAGDVEVSADPFPPEPGEKASPGNTSPSTP
jgi:hypothetical protein